MVNANDILNYTEDQIWSIPLEPIDVQCADKVVNVPAQWLILSSYYWRLFKDFPGAQIESKHLLQKPFTTDTHLSLGGIIFWDVYKHAINQYENIIWDISRVFYEITSSIDNASRTRSRLTSSVTSSSLYDFVELIKLPEIIEAKSEYLKKVTDAKYDEKVTANAIDDAHKKIEKALYADKPELNKNGIKQLCNANIVNKGQMIQLIGPRGFVHDIDGRVFKYPIDVGYIEGLGNLYDSAIESRSASKSLYMTEDPLEDSEYFNREMQLLCSTVHSIVGESCTGYITSPWLVAEDEEYLLRGKNYMVDGVPKMIWGDISDLVGKTIQLRTMSGCNNHDPQTVCKTCLGWSWRVIPPNSNLGYTIGSILCAIMSQLMLSNKHYTSSAPSQTFELNDRHAPWLRMHKTDKLQILLQKNVVKKNPIIRIETGYVRNLNNILSAEVSELPPSRITSIKSFVICEGDGKGNVIGDFDELKTVISGQGINLSSQVLQYLKKNGWKSNPIYIEFELLDWDAEVPIFVVPRIGDNIHLFQKDVKSFIMPTKENEISITSFNTRGSALAEFTNLLKKRLKFNLIQVEIFVRACMTVNGNEGDYRLPRAGENFSFMSAKQCLYHRSLTTLLAYEIQAGAVADTIWYKDMPRHVHMLDTILDNNQ